MEKLFLSVKECLKYTYIHKYTHMNKVLCKSWMLIQMSHVKYPAILSFEVNVCSQCSACVFKMYCNFLHTYFKTRAIIVIILHVMGFFHHSTIYIYLNFVTSIVLGTIIVDLKSNPLLVQNKCKHMEKRTFN